MANQTYVGTLEVIGCYACGIDFGMTSQFYRSRHEDHGTFYCPDGHSQHFVAKSTKQLLEEERARVQRLRDIIEDERNEHRRTYRQLTATRGVLTRTKNRIAGGVCPCCGRTFVALGKHMATKHPDYVAKDLP